MAIFTNFLKLLKKDPIADGQDTFNIETMLNENWDKIDEKVEENTSAIGQLTSYLEYMPINGGAFDGNEPSGVTIDGGTY